MLLIVWRNKKIGADMKDGIKEKYTNCKYCGTKCNHDDDGYDECRFCLSTGNTLEVQIENDTPMEKP
jgi:hypothetical protein